VNSLATLTSDQGLRFAVVRSFAYIKKPANWPIYSSQISLGTLEARIPRLRIRHLSCAHDQRQLHVVRRSRSGRTSHWSVATLYHVSVLTDLCRQANFMVLPLQYMFYMNNVSRSWKMISTSTFLGCLPAKNEPFNSFRDTYIRVHTRTLIRICTTHTYTRAITLGLYRALR
jgi:hypothetical protein